MNQNNPDLCCKSTFVCPSDQIFPERPDWDTNIRALASCSRTIQLAFVQVASSYTWVYYTNLLFHHASAISVNRFSLTTSKSALVLDIQWRTFARIPGFSHPSLASDPPSQFEEDFRTLQGNRWVLRPSGIGKAGAPRCRPNPKLSTDTCAAAGGTFGGIWNVSYFQFQFD